VIKIGLLTKIFGDYSTKEIKRIKPLTDKVLSLDEEYSKLTNEELQSKTLEFKERLNDGETLDDILPEAFATCREAAWRVLGMKPFPVQIIGGIILHQGRIAEMKTGEGKTLTETLPTYLNALSGNGVHIVTVNEYLAKRDSEQMGKVFRFLGLSVGLIYQGMEPKEKQAAYNADITYGTNNEFGFDYLRDNMVTDKNNKVQRGHNFAIVDEVDSILIDEARTPLIISGKGGTPSELYKTANDFARSLKYTKIKESDSKENMDETATEDADVVVDEKARTAVLTKSGVKKAEEAFGLDNLMDIDNLTFQHHINQAIKAIGVMTRDIDYVVKEDQVLIVDEFTGRIMPGRRYNEGLHQAIEAKENIEVKHESKTLATITFQNYFRLYEKLSGMTGTAITEEAEFNQIYSLDVVTIPTNKPVIREDLSDVVYKTEKGKLDAIVEAIAECHEKGQPVLVGTTSIEKSERLSRLLKKNGIKHNVLNAKVHDKEAEIVAQAGKYGAVTIATNMAGRGTDIKLGGNAEYLAKAEMKKLEYPEELITEATGFAETDNEEILAARELYKSLEDKYSKEIEPEAEKVREAGGLCIIGTERHESRRVDNQLRGRSGRQGDPGMSRFYLSLDDELMRLFGGSKVTSLMDALKTPEDMPLETKLLSNTIENAQKNVEGRNFAVRKSVLQYDDVMNKQRELIYRQRNQVLDGEELKPIILRMITNSINDAVDMFCSESVPEHEWNIAGLKDKYKTWGLIEPDDFENGEDREEIRDILLNRAETRYEEKEEDLGLDTFGEPYMRKLERLILLKTVDFNWMNHIDEMDQLRKGIGLRAYGNSDPVIAYREIGSDMFDCMNDEIRENTARQMLTFVPQREEKPKPVAIPVQFITPQTKPQPITPIAITPPASTQKKRKQTPNELCACGSGKKYKKCCGDVRNNA